MTPEAIFPVEDPEFDALFAEEAAMVDASQLIAAALESSGMSKTELAHDLGVSKSEITARLAGERNITVRKLAATLHALGARLELSTREPAMSEAQSRLLFDRWRREELPASTGHRSDAHHSVASIGEWRQARRA